MSHEKKYDYSTDIDDVNLKIAINRIKSIVTIKMKNNYLLNDHFEIFKFNDDDKCPLTGYFIYTLFVGPCDDFDYYNNHNLLNATDEIKNVITTYGNYEILRAIEPNKYVYHVIHKK